MDRLVDLIPTVERFSWLTTELSLEELSGCLPAMIGEITREIGDSGDEGICEESSGVTCISAFMMSSLEISEEEVGCDDVGNHWLVNNKANFSGLKLNGPLSDLNL